MTARTFSFGRDGEAKWGALHAAVRLSGRNGYVGLVVSDSRDVRDEVRRRMEAEAMSSELQVILPNKDVVAAIHACAKARAGSGSVPVAWIEAGARDHRDDERKQWIEALVGLNQARDALLMHGPCCVILAGARALHKLVTQRAPDLSSFLNSALLLGDTLEALASDPELLTWMHLSDLHVGREDWQRDDVLGALVRDLPELLMQRGLHPDLLLVTGDIAAKSAKTGYDGAFVVLEKITNVLGIDRQHHVYMVAGNHDVDREKIGDMVARYHDSLISLKNGELLDTVGTLLGETDEFRMYGKRLTAWCEFTERFLGRARSVSLERPWRSDVVDIAGMKVGVISLCSAWASGTDKDNGRLLLGERQLANMVSEVNDGGAQLVICLMHHPLDWLHPDERIAIRNRIDRDVDLFLHGHVHAPYSAVQASGARRHATIGAGAAYAGLANDRYHGFSVGQLDPAAKTVTIHQFTWSTASGKWHIDPGAPGADDQGKVVLTMALPTLGTGAPSTGGTEVLGSRLRQAAARVYDSIDFAGLGTGGPRGHVTLDDLFVPLRLSADAHSGSRAHAASEPEDTRAKAHGAGMTMATLEASLFSSGPTSADATRVVVLGAPGSGKSTLCRYLATTAARREWGPVPLLLTVRDWVAEGQHESLLDMAAREATQRLSVRTDAEALEQLCSNGNVLLIIDGIDEAPNADTRRKLRERVLGLAIRFPSVAILVTSRVTGYDEVPLNDDVFSCLTLKPFDDEALGSFIRRWYDQAEPDDPIVRQRKRVELTVALDREPRAKELARNPLLATLIAMVHFTHARLPGDRAKLYGQIVELLLISWPADRARRFAELEGVTQVPMLERVALAMQEQSQGGARGRGVQVVVDRTVFVDMLAAQLRERSTACDEHEIVDLARRWSTWLVRDAGLFQEHSPGRVGFLHLSLMEYMAGRALLTQSLREGHEGVAACVEQHLEDSRWEETLLLMLGSENKNRALGEAVVERLLSSGSAWQVRPGPVIFLLQLLREDVEVGAPLRARILERTRDGMLDWHAGIRNLVSHLIDDVAAFGRVHRPGLETWFREHLTRDTGDGLAGTLALCPASAPSEKDVHDIMANREDLDVAVVVLLNFGTAHRWGRLGHRLASTEAMNAWANTSPVEAIFTRSVGAAYHGNGESVSMDPCSWVIPLLRRAGWIAETILFAAAQLREEPRGNAARGIPPAIASSSGPSSPIDRAPPALSGSSGSMAPFHAHDLWRDGSTPPVSTERDPSFPKMRPRLWTDDLWRLHCLQRSTGVVVSPAHAHKDVESLLAQLRVQNLWLNADYFDRLGPRPDESSPDFHALALTVGLVQYQTTWTWPASPHWQIWFTPSPPEHWLSAHLWHVIRYIQDPTDASHRERADACLDRGDSPRMVDALRDHALTPTPPEVLALFSSDDATSDDSA
ncbi:MAG: NACHT domain-containing protein [Nannocystaceae bacterium]